MKKWKWGMNKYKYKGPEDVEAGIADYLIQELDSDGLGFVKAPNGALFVIRVSAELVPQITERTIPC